MAQYRRLSRRRSSGIRPSVWGLIIPVLMIGVGSAIWFFAIVPAFGMTQRGSMSGEAALTVINQLLGETVDAPTNNAFYGYEVAQDRFYWIHFMLPPDDITPMLTTADNLCFESLVAVEAAEFINAPDYAWWQPETAASGLGEQCGDAIRLTVFVDTRDNAEDLWHVYIEFAQTS